MGLMRLTTTDTHDWRDRRIKVVLNTDNDNQIKLLKVKLNRAILNNHKQEISNLETRLKLLMKSRQHYEVIYYTGD